MISKWITRAIIRAYRRCETNHNCDNRYKCCDMHIQNVLDSTRRARQVGSPESPRSLDARYYSEAQMTQGADRINAPTRLVVRRKAGRDLPPTPRKCRGCFKGRGTTLMMRIRALTGIASVGILAVTVGVETANAQSYRRNGATRTYIPQPYPPQGRGSIPRGGPRTVPFSDPNSPEATGGGNIGYNHGLPDGGN